MRLLAIAAVLTLAGLPGAAGLNIAVCGGGPGGLATAVACAQRLSPASRVTVYEARAAADDRRSLGGGVQLNGGAAVLAKLGVDVRTFGVPAEAVVTRRCSDSKQLLRLDLVDALARASDPAPLTLPTGEPAFYLAMRHKLQDALRKKAAASRGVTLRRGAAVSGVASTSEGPCVALADGSTEGPFDLVVGADGVSSTVRAAAFPNAPAPVDSGIRIAFGVCKKGARPKGAAGELHQWFGENAYALTASYGESEMVALVYCADDDASENAAWQTGGKAAKAACVRRLAEAGMPAEVAAVAEASPDSGWFDVGVRWHVPMLSWNARAGTVVLVGDAAHAMPPFLGQGANQAVADAYCLGERLAELEAGGHGGDLEKALRSYEATRKPAVTAIQLESVFLGYLETQSGPGAVGRDAFFTVMGAVGVAERIFLEGAVPRV